MPRTRRRRFAASAPTSRRLPSLYHPVLQDLERRALLATLGVPAPYATIAAAVAAANPAGGDTILVSPGTYSVDHVVINKPLTLISTNGAGSTFLTGDNAPEPEEGSIEVQNTTGTVTIGNVNQGFTFENPVVRSSDSYISSLYVTGNSAPVIVQYNSFVGLNGVNNPFDVGMNSYQSQAGGTLFVQNNDFSKMFQGLLLEVPLGGATVQSNTFHNLVVQHFGGSTYEPEGVFALTYGGAAGNVDGMTIGSNDFKNFNGLAITVSGGYGGQPAAKFTNVSIAGNAITAIGFAPNQFRAGIVIQNGADTAADAPNGGVDNSSITGNTIAAAVPCSAGSRGVWVLGRNNNLTINNNFIQNLDRGVVVQEQTPGAGTASGMAVNRNSFTGNTQAIENDSTHVVNAKNNYWGTNNPLYVKAQANGGVNVNYDPWIGDPTDTDLVADGFQPNLAALETAQISISGPDSVLKTATYTLNLNNANYPNSPRGFPLTNYSIDFGDGSGPQSFPGTSTTATHAYASAGNFNITGTATDSNGNTYTIAMATDPSGMLYRVTDANGNLYPAPNAIPVNVTNFSTLLVTHFYPNPSGFSVRFNQQLDTNVLHLYTSNLPAYTNTVGPTNVTLVGASTGPVQGSLVIDADGMGFTFIKTSAGGAADNTPLPADTYTVDLVSNATTGIRSSPGLAALDGNNDGSPGGDYVTTFTKTGTRSVAIADFVRGPGQPVIVPAATGTGLPVQISDSTGVQTADLFIHYDPTRLTINAANPVTLDPALPAGTQVAVNSSVPGLLEICLRSPTPLPAGIKNLIELNASVPSSASNLYTSKEAITVDQVSLVDGSGNPIAATGDNGFHAVGYLGDTSGNGVINSFDATLLQRYILGKDTGFGAFKDADPILIGDISANGVVNSFDVTLIQRYILGQNPPQIPAIPNLAVSQSGPDPLLSLPSGLTVSPGGAVSVPVDFRLTAAQPVGLESFDFAIAYDPSAFRVAGVSGGTLSSGYELTWSTDVSPGLLVVTASRVAGPVTLTPGESGTLAVLDLQALPGASAGVQPLRFLGVSYAGGGPRVTALNDGRLTTVTADGSVLVQRPAPGGRTTSVSSSAVDQAIESFRGLAGVPVAGQTDSNVNATRIVVASNPVRVAPVVTVSRAAVVRTAVPKPAVVFDKIRSVLG